MISEINLNNGPSCWSCCDFVRRPVGAEILLAITSIAVSILLSAPLAIATSAPLSLMIGLGASIGLILAIAIITYRRFSSDESASKDSAREKPLDVQAGNQNLNLNLLKEDKAEPTETSLEKEAVFTSSDRISAKRETPDGAAGDEGIAPAIAKETDAPDGSLSLSRKLTEEVNKAEEERTEELLNIRQRMEEPFPQSFPKDILFFFFSYTGLSLKTLKAIACTSKEINALVYSINEMRLKKVEKLPLYIGLETWKDFGWFYSVGNDDRAPLIFPDIIEKFTEDKGTMEKQAILLIPNMVALSTLQMCAAKTNPTLKSVYCSIDKEIEKQYFQKVQTPYFVVITLDGISRSGKKTLREQSEMVSSFAGLSGYQYRLPHLVEVVALTYLCRLKFGMFLFSMGETRTLERLSERKRATVGHLRENSELFRSGLHLGSADGEDNYDPLLGAVAASSATKNDLNPF